MKKRRKSKKIEHCSYVIRIEDWTTSYSLSVDREGRFGLDPYWEHGALEIIGVVLAPGNLQDRRIKVDFLADRRLPLILSGSENAGYEPRCVGALTARGQRTEYLGSLPTDVFQTLPSLLQAGKLNFIVFWGHTLYRGSADISSVHFQREHDPDDW
ncbi:MAG: hypothetical protein GTO13_10410 [Proteobacteria bacterium]|nr:hypothetical protein [Pseudomonadota bacterium]